MYFELRIETCRCREDPHLTPDLGIEPGPHLWEASDLTTAPSLHPLKSERDRCISIIHGLMIDPHNEPLLEPMGKSIQVPHSATHYVTVFLQTDLFLVYFSFVKEGSSGPVIQ